MTIRAVLAAAAARLEAADVKSPRLDARVLLAHAMGIASAALSGHARAPDTREQALFDAFVTRRVAHEPVAYITGRKEFWSLEFRVGPGALIPRPETETLIEQLIAQVPDREAPLDILDLGTGSGCLLVAALHEYPRARGSGIDASEAALYWARQNAALHKLDDRIALELSDWSGNIGGCFDAILTNPPYIRSKAIAALTSDIVRYEPSGALDGGEDGLDAYRVLAARIVPLLKPDGVLLAEIGEGQSGQVTAIFEANQIGTVAIASDLAGIPRCVVGRPRNRQM